MRKSLMRGALRGLPILAGLLMLSGCDAVLFDPKGPIGESEKSLILTATYLMLVVVIPVIFMTLWFAWRYRDTKQSKATYTPNWAHSTKIEAVVWGIPCLIILALGILTWKSTHELDPRAEIVDGGEPIEVQVIAMDWKWLFIYPEQGIATVNELAMPVDRQVRFHITSDTVMNSFFVPQLGSQIYAMAGMENRLHLIGSEVGTYDGISASYSGAGFADMHFKAHVMSEGDFDAWIEKARGSSKVLDDAGLAALKEPSEDVAPTFYGQVKPNLYEQIMAPYMDGMELGMSDDQMRHMKKGGMHHDSAEDGMSDHDASGHAESAMATEE